jgi:hypothetical protein
MLSDAIADFVREIDPALNLPKRRRRFIDLPKRLQPLFREMYELLWCLDSATSPLRALTDEELHRYLEIQKTEDITLDTGDVVRILSACIDSMENYLARMPHTYTGTIGEAALRIITGLQAWKARAEKKLRREGAWDGGNGRPTSQRP